MSFVHLHVHSHFSLLDGLSRFDELIKTAKEDGAPAVSLTDHGVMYGAIEFYQKCKKAGIKPIIGVEAYLAKNSRFDRTGNQDDEKRNYHLLLLAKDFTGYKNLLKLTATAHLEGYYYKPRIDWEILQKHSQGLIACTACIGGEIPQLILAAKLEKAEQRILDYNNLFGAGNFYLEIQPHESFPEQDVVNRHLVEFSKKLNVPLVATNDIHYLRAGDYDSQDILLCLQTKKKKKDVDRFNMHGIDFYYKTEAEMRAAFDKFPEALDNTLKIAEACNLEIPLGQIQLPHFEVPEGFTDITYLEKLCREGLMGRYGKSYEEIEASTRDRLDYEMSVVAKMGFASYFLIVADFVNWAKNQKIVVGPGRGSAAGSLICYLTGITNLDPLKYNLLFERFLNPDRISMPDIDMDFADARRDEVLRYVEEKYGKDHVAQIITFGTMAARAAVRDVGRVLDYPYDYCDRLAKMIPPFSTLEEALEDAAELKDIYTREEQAREIIEYAKRLEGVSRHASTHACGVLITKEALVEYVPLQYAVSQDDKEKKNIVSQYSLHPVEDLGLLKMDFLGLKNLTIIESAIKIIKKMTGEEINIDQIPLDDKLAYKLFQDGETTGVFQFESSGMKRYLKELKPTDLEDIIAMVALYRPGPMEWIPDYIAGKHKKKKIQYLHPKLEPILSKTYGVAIYQEQVMQMARDLAGFTMGQADVLRKAMGKKIVSLLVEQKEKFVAGCVKEGISGALAEKIFSFIEPFAGYGFNRSHAACYAMIGYQTAYLKAHWPDAFMAALMTSDQQKIDRLTIEIEECRKMGMDVLPPDINQSFSTFTAVAQEDAKAKKRIRFGLKAIKNVGENIADAIIEERKTGGAYKDLTDFLTRVENKDLNKKSLESLIKSGAFDAFGERGILLANIDRMLAFHKEAIRAKNSSQTSLFGAAPNLQKREEVRLEAAKEAGRQEKLAWEKELLGLYITEHPFLDYKKYLENVITPMNELPQIKPESAVAIAGIVIGSKKIITRSGDAMLFVKFEDNLGGTEILVFPKLLKDTPNVWVDGGAVLCSGKVSDKDGETKILADKAVKLTLENIEQVIAQFKNNAPKGHPECRAVSVLNTNNTNALKLIFKAENLLPASIEALREFLAANRGADKVYFKIPTSDGARVVESGFLVANNQELAKAIAEKFKDFVEIV